MRIKGGKKSFNVEQGFAISEAYKIDPKLLIGVLVQH